MWIDQLDPMTLFVIILQNKLFQGKIYLSRQAIIGAKQDILAWWIKINNYFVQSEVKIQK